MIKFLSITLVLSCLTLFFSGCYNAERHARRLNESVENIFLDGTGVN